LQDNNEESAKKGRERRNKIGGWKEGRKERKEGKGTFMFLMFSLLGFSKQSKKSLVFLLKKKIRPTEKKKIKV